VQACVDERQNPRAVAEASVKLDLIQESSDVLLVPKDFERDVPAGFILGGPDFAAAALAEAFSQCPLLNSVAWLEGTRPFLRAST
jgi:hypothetical protein